MRSHSLTLLLVLSGAIVFAGCSAAGNKVTRIQQPGTTTTPTTYADGARRITIIELQDLIKKHEAFILDVRNDAMYNAGHIPGAKLIPAAEILNHLDELPKDKLIVTYCSWPNEHTSAGAVVNLKTKNITNAAALLGGFNEWQREGLPVDKVEAKQ